MKIAILGYGKMGKAIERLALERGDEIVLRVGGYNREQVSDDELKKADVAVEFSRPDAAVENYAWCFRNGVPVVSGTTGWLDRWQEVVALCETLGGGFFYASNFSVGVNIFFHVNQWVAKRMARFENYRASVEETHHVHKLDAPSGTAITLAEGILAENDRYVAWKLQEEGMEANQLPVTVKREGEVPGTHVVTYKSEVDEIEIRHAAYSRDGFAKGALWAAAFMQGKKGVYSMEDLLAW